MKILVFGGTTEGRILAGRLSALGHAVTVSVATEQGAQQLKGIPCRVLTGEMEEEEIAGILPGYDLVVDATHPYAANVSANIRKACTRTGTAMERILRQASDMDGCLIMADHSRAAAFLAGTTGNILLAIGTRGLLLYGQIDPERIYARVLPSQKALLECEKLNIRTSHILAMQGPFSTELNAAILRQFHIRYLVTKDGGSEGGFPQKREAALLTGAVLVVVRRPEPEEKGRNGISMEDFLARIQTSETLSSAFP